MEIYEGLPLFCKDRFSTLNRVFPLFSFSSTRYVGLRNSFRVTYYLNRNIYIIVLPYKRGDLLKIVEDAFKREVDTYRVRLLIDRADLDLIYDLRELGVELETMDAASGIYVELSGKAEEVMDAENRLVAMILNRQKRAKSREVAEV
jgi:hypothetical protein